MAFANAALLARAPAPFVGLETTHISSLSAPAHRESSTVARAPGAVRSTFHGSATCVWLGRHRGLRPSQNDTEVRRRAERLTITGQSDAQAEVISDDDVLDEDKRLVISWDEVTQLAGDVVQQLKESLHGNSARRTYDLLLAITRGGMVPGCLVSEALELRQCLTASVMFYTGNAAGLTLETPAFLQFPNDVIFEGKKVLLVDDCWDTGSTIMAVKDRVLRAGASSVTVAVLHWKSTESKFPDDKPDFFARETDATWLVYPWENEASGLGKIG
eukprot:tig00000655_g2868.t1